MAHIYQSGATHLLQMQQTIQSDL